MKEEERLETEAMARRLRKDLITKTFPKTREDFDQLYAMASIRIYAVWYQNRKIQYLPDIQIFYKATVETLWTTTVSML